MPQRTDWQADESRVLVVAGRDARDQALKQGIYQCQNRRAFRPSRWIAFYADGRIDTLAEIEGPPEDDVLVANRPDLADVAGDMPWTHGRSNEPRTILRLKNAASVGPIENDKRDRLGRKTAWTQSQGYTTIERLRAAKYTSEL